MAGGDVQEFFCEGLTEEATVRLACACPRQVAVVAKTTAKLISAAENAGASLTDPGVDFILEASVRGAGHRVRVVARLIDVEANAYLWADTCECEVSDTLDVQSEIADRIAQAVAHALVDATADLATA
jgi:TolB-like protein